MKKEMSMKEQNTRYAASVRDDLRRIWNGVCGVDFDEDECEDGRDADGNPVTLEAYIDDALDVEFTLDSSKRLIGVTLYVAVGGPTCWIDTRRKEIVCAWGTESDNGWARLDGEIAEAINCHFDEFMTF